MPDKFNYFLLILLLFISITAVSAQNKTKIILDTDIGTDIDDAWALAFVISHQEFEPLGITVADGHTPARAKIVCKMLAQTGLGKIPVAVGRKTDEKYPHQFAWAEDFTAKKPIRQSAADFIVEQVRKYPGQVILLAVGPLQNIADALRQEPNLGKLVKRVVLMSGNIYNSAYKTDGPIREYNVYMSTKDSQLVYSAGLPLTIVPLDSTTKVQLQDDERARLQKYESPLTFAVECLYRLWISNPKMRMTLHDQLAVAEAAKPGAFFQKLETLPIVIDDQGFTRIDKERGKPVVVCLEPKRDEFMKYYLDELTSQKLGMKK